MVWCEISWGPVTSSRPGSASEPQFHPSYEDRWVLKPTVVSTTHGGTFISSPIMKASFVESLLEMFGNQSHRPINQGLSHFLVTQKLHAQGLSQNRRQPEKRILLFLKALKTCGLFSQRGDAFSVPSMFHKVSLQFPVDNSLIVSPASEWAWGGGQHDSIATTTLMKRKRKLLATELARGYLQLLPRTN